LRSSEEGDDLASISAAREERTGERRANENRLWGKGVKGELASLKKLSHDLANTERPDGERRARKGAGTSVVLLGKDGRGVRKRRKSGGRLT